MALSSLDKLGKVRELMREKQLDAYVVPSEDAHSSEYLAPCDARRAHVTSFTGSAGCAVITKDTARCWTDGRYWLQAEKQLGAGWTLMKQGLTDVPTWPTWLKTELPASSRVGIDPTLISYSDSETLSTSLGSTLVPVTDNLIDLFWASDRPARPASEIFHLEDKYTGEPLSSKLGRMREVLSKTGAQGIVISQLDEVAWLFNLRASDIPYNPVFFAYAIITPDECTLFANPKSLTEPVRQYLHVNGVAVLEYDRFWSSLTSLNGVVSAARANKPLGAAEKARVINVQGMKINRTDKVLIGTKTSWAIAQALGEDNVEVRRSCVEEAKAKKNATEVEGFRQSHIRDGAALCRYFAWLEEVLGRDEQWTEYDAATVLENYRRENKLFMGLSFDTISSTGANAAIIHYSPPQQGSSFIDRNQMYLCDSGGGSVLPQYLDGTTDTTRTWHFGTPSELERRAFTRVLQGHISLDTVVFPEGTTGYVLDILARRALWSDGLDYRHSTSHGVGSFLNVHEGPQGVGQRIQYNDVPLVAGMVISNEPGYYRDGEFGIRIENIDVIKLSQTRENFGGKEYLELERVTMCPIQTKLIDTQLLAPVEREWINGYHAEVLEKVSPLLKEFGDERALTWLEKECRAI
ncbi:peptidase M24, structural domain-containing protein [Papiliotrema laurentii]|uniref:Peptidase M24, structural domain-containing protein n=1 Tax=Papiliotrema laurentii TaxID=5418 RepID=A0AAD9FU64_PAPLA|nr:peptidase M24, structural domain-containing protein [Papiliotrema laurentii]